MQMRFNNLSASPQLAADLFHSIRNHYLNLRSHLFKFHFLSAQKRKLKRAKRKKDFVVVDVAVDEQKQKYA